MHWKHWSQLSEIGPKEYVCGFCAKDVASNKGYFHHEGGRFAYIYICPNCSQPTFFNWNNDQFPGPLIGRQIQNLPEDIESVYLEVRETVKNNCFTSAVLLGRKLIMHIAVDKAGAKEGDTFINYVSHLKKSKYIPQGSEKWLKYLKDLGNEKNHEIKIGTKKEAEKILKFIELLLIFTYELPGESFEEDQ